MAVLRAALGQVSEPTTVAMFLDGSQELIALVPVRRKRTAALVRACEREETSVVVVSMFPTENDWSPGEQATESWNRARVRLEAEGMTLLDWLVVRDDGWQSLAAGPAGWQAA